MAKIMSKIIYENTKTAINYETGEVESESKEYVVTQASEPPFVKVYLDCLSMLKNYPKSLNPILLGFMKHMTYANVSEDNGGQLIFVNKTMKEIIAKECEVKIDRVNQALTEFVKSSCFRRVSTSTYQVNPKYFGRGDWRDIKSIRATINFSDKGIEIKQLKLENAKKENKDLENIHLTS
jgi:hypothetical protein